MVWSEAKDRKLLRAIGAEGVFINNKAGSRERGVRWQNVASALVEEALPVTLRSVRDRYNGLAKKWRAKVASEAKESGGGHEHLTEVEVLLEELVELESESEKIAEQQDEEKKATAAQEKKKATEMRGLGRQRRDMERLRKTMGKKNLKEEDQEGMLWSG